MGAQIAQALEPLDRLDRTLDQHLSIIQPLIDQATKQMQKQIDGLAHDRVQRSARMAREQHQKSRAAAQWGKGWKNRAGVLLTQVEAQKEQYEKAQKARKRWMMSTIALGAILIVILTKWLVT